MTPLDAAKHRLHILATQGHDAAYGAPNVTGLAGMFQRIRDTRLVAESEAELKKEHNLKGPTNER